MPETKVEIKVVVEYNPTTKQLESMMTSTPGTIPDAYWEALKLNIVQMVKVAPYISDPTIRENMELAARAMKAIVLGTESAIAQIRKSQENVMKELGHG